MGLALVFYSGGWFEILQWTALNVKALNVEALKLDHPYWRASAAREWKTKTNKLRHINRNKKRKTKSETKLASASVEKKS